MNIVRIHGIGTTLMLLSVGSGMGYVAYKILSHGPNQEGLIWGLAMAVFSMLCLYSGIRGRS